MAAASYLIAFLAARLALGPLDEVSIDPRTIALSLTSRQWTIIAAAMVAVGAVLAVVIAAVVHAASEPGIGTLEALGRVRADSLQIFWFQYVIYALAMRFSPGAAILLWIPAAFAVPVAVCENLGPARAVDRAWELSRGTRGRIVALGLLLPLLPLSILIAISYLARPGGFLGIFSFWPRTGITVAGGIAAVALFEFLFVTLTRVYKAQSSEPALHVQAASSVSS